MAGLGTKIGSQFTLRSLMNGSTTIGGNTYTAWYFAEQSAASAGRGFMGDRQMPSVHLECIEGQQVSIDFKNESPFPHTVHLHGLDVAQRFDGVPATSPTVTSGQSYEYRFKAPHAGTYHYHCHVDTLLHYARGMLGTVIVRPPGGSTNLAWAGGPTFDEEVLWQLQTVDTSWFSQFTSGPATARFRPDGFLLNGLETPAAQADPFSKVVIAQGQRAYVRVLNAAYNWARVSLGGLAFDVVASDGRPMRSVLRTRSFDLGPGERYDLLLEGVAPGSYAGRIDYLNDYDGSVLGSVETLVEIL